MSHETLNDFSFALIIEKHSDTRVNTCMYTQKPCKSESCPHHVDLFENMFGFILFNIIIILNLGPLEAKVYHRMPQ